MDNITIWEKAQHILSENLSPTLLKLCFTKTQVLEIAKNGAGFRVVVSYPNYFLLEQVEKRCQRFLIQALEKILKDRVTLELKVVPSNNSQFKNPVEIKNNNHSLNTKDHKFLQYTFENFVVGESNRLAYSAAQAVCHNPGTLYNPLFIYGGTGLGKTHLLQAILSKLTQNSHTTKVCYKTTEAFTNEYIEALATGSVRAFREKYRQANVLLIDDVHFLSGKPSTQDEFFHTFNELYTARHQIVLTSDRHPAEIGKLTDRLVSRFLGGLTCDIAPPELELKIAILTKKAALWGVALEDEVCQFVAQNVSSPREIDGVIATLVESARVGNKSSTQVVYELFSKKQQPRVSAKQIVAAVSKFYGLKTTQVLGTSRKKEIVRARQMAMFLLRNELGLSYDFIGKIFGGKDHSTVIHGFEALRAGLEKNPNLKEDLFEIKRSLGF